MPDLESDIFSSDIFSFDAGQQTAGNTLHSDLNPRAKEFFYNGDNSNPNPIHPILKSNIVTSYVLPKDMDSGSALRKSLSLNTKTVTHLNSISKILPKNLNPLAATFICRKGNTNAIKMNGSVLAFLTFILLLSCYIVNDISLNTFVPKSSCEGLGLSTDDPSKILKEIRIKNVNRVIIGTLNINSLPPKFEPLKSIIGNYLDILVIQETKLDPSFSSEQFLIDG